MRASVVLVGGLAMLMAMAAMLTAAARPALAYVRAVTDDTAVPLFWPDPRKVLELARPPDGLSVSIAHLRLAAQLAANSWSHSSLSCTGVSLSLAQDPTDSQVAGRDGINRIIMRTGAWFRDPVAMTHPHPDALALTTIFSRARPGQPDDGQMLEADIEINAVDGMEWGIVPEGSYSARDFANTYDLTSVVTHETGHFIGLDHTCMVPGALLRVDDTGVASPSCTNIPADKQSLIEDATMYPYMETNDITLRTLTSDDQRAACEIYPAWSVPRNEWVGAGGCSQAPVPSTQQPSSLAVVSTLLLAAATLARDRRRRPGASKSAVTPRGRDTGGPA